MRPVLPLAAICLTAACGGAGGSTSDVSVSRGVLTIEDQPQIAISEAPSTTFESMLNGVRGEVGANPVSYESRLGSAARRHANDMHANDFFSHTGSDNSDVGLRVRETGYRHRYVGENIAKGQQSEASVLDDWQDSTGHRKNNENPEFEHFGLAKAGSGRDLYWVLVLADPL